MIEKLEFVKEDLPALLRRVVAASKTARDGEYAFTTGVSGHLRVFSRAFAICASRLAAGGTLSGAERWFFDNYYLIQTARSSLSRAEKLPCGVGGVRIERLAMIIVRGSRSCLDRDRVLKCLTAANSAYALNIAELKGFSRALTRAALDGLYILAERLLYHDKMRRLATEDTLRPKYLKSDVYTYYAYKNESLRPRFPLQTPIAATELRAAYVNSLLENEALAEYLFNIIRDTRELSELSTIMQVSKTVQGLEDICGFSGLSEATQLYYVNYIEKIAKKCRTREAVAVSALKQFCELKAKDAGDVIFNYSASFAAYLSGKGDISADKGGALRESAYVATCVLLAFAVTAVIGYYFLGWYSLLIALPLIVLCERLILPLLSSNADTGFVPSLRLIKLTESTRTAVVLSHYVANERDIVMAIEHVNLIKAANKDPQIDVVLLIDFKSADTKETEQDDLFISKLSSLQGRANINVFVRSRRLCDGKFCGYERKRGAIEALNKLYLTGDKSEFCYIANSYKAPKYILLLDADSEIEPHTVVDLVGVMEHPANAGYDLCALRAKYNAYSLKTRYTRRFIGDGGLERYPQYSSAYYRLFGKELFCGKGLYRLKSFSSKLDGLFPDGKVLSHDVLEGAVLNTFGSGVQYEDAPQNFIADESRNARWTRGDIQLLPFVGGRWRNRVGEKITADFGAFNRFIMLKNALSVLNPVCLFVAFLIGAFTLWPLAIAALAVPVVPLIVAFVSQVRETVKGKRARYAAAVLFKELLLTCESILLLPYRAVRGVYLFLSTLFKMSVSRKLLDWTPFAHTDGQNNILAYLKLFAPSQVLLTALALLSFILYPSSFVWLISYATLNIIIIFALYASGMPYNSALLSQEDKEFLYMIAEKTYGYFSMMREKTSLIADNFQVCPALGKSPRTSPTNLGFQMLAEISAFYLKLATMTTVLKNLEDDIGKIEKLKKWKGNLYNWYSIDGSVVSPYVSSVDSGNLSACLMAVAGFLQEESQFKLLARVEKLLQKTNLSAFYDTKRQLFYIGYDKARRSYEGHYDLLASESRLLSYVYTAQSENVTHWRALSRDCTALYGNTLLSWSGTMFEYLMPILFLDAAKGSLLDTSEINAVKAQRSQKCAGIWGRSESGENKVDLAGWYQYRAYGVQSLAMRVEDNGSVLSPYSTFLAMQKDLAAVENLKALSKINMLEKYGYYEAVDVSKNGGRIMSYMTHHQGMIMASIFNLMCDKKLQKLFMKSSVMSSARLLLTEPKVNNSNVNKCSYLWCNCQNNECDYSNISKIQEYSHKIYSLSNELVSIKVDNFANNEFFSSGKYFSKPDVYKTGEFGAKFFLKNLYGKFENIYDKKIANKHLEISQNMKQVLLNNKFRGCELEVSKNDCLNARWFRISQTAQVGKAVPFAYFEEVLLTSIDQYASHPQYARMCIDASYDKDNSAIIIKRYSQTKKDDVYAAIVLKGLSNVECCFDKSVVLSRYSENAFNFDWPDKQCQRPVNPIVAFKAIPCEYDNGRYIFDIVSFFASSMDELYSKIRIVNTAEKGFNSITSGFNICDNALKVNLINALACRTSQVRLGEIYFKGEVDAYLDYTKGKQLVLYCFRGDSKSLSEFCEALRVASCLGYDTALVVSYRSDNPSYFSTISNILNSSFVLDYRIVRVEDESLMSKLNRFAHVVYDGKLSACGVAENATGSVISSLLPAIKGGLHFENGGFCADGAFAVTSPTALPYSNVVALPYGGFVATENGGGYTYFGNSREDKATAFFPDPISDRGSEYLFARQDGVYLLNRGGPDGGRTVHSFGKTEYYNEFPTFSSKVSLFMINGGNTKIYKVSVNGNVKIELLFAYLPALGWKPDDSYIFTRGSGDTAVTTNLKNGKSLYVRMLSRAQLNVGFSGEEEPVPFIKCSARIAENDVIYIAVSMSEQGVISLTPEGIEKGLTDSLSYFEKYTQAVSLDCPDKALQKLFPWLSYQTLSSRINAKCGYYQTGGATGFRDQLQDAVALAFIDPKLLKNQIIEAASHQYLQGDVQHWWHTETFGARTTVSDDKLFLPWATGEYVLITGDKTILHSKLPFLISKPLANGEKTRVENAERTAETASLNKHCNLAIKNALRFGEHGLLVMGSGDWNDSLDSVGAEMRGESVVTSLMAVLSVEKYKHYLGDRDRMALAGIQSRLISAVNNHCFFDDRYARMFDDNGNVLGIKGSEALTLDLVPQTLAVLTEVVEKDKAIELLKNAETLLKKDISALALLAPPQDRSSNLGYISTYPKGVRENGGQYTHAVMWYIAALLKVGEVDRAYEYFKFCNPVWRTENETLAAKYKTEPYVIAADIYTENGQSGQGGWTWYTGSAGWAMRIVYEGFFGLKRRGKSLSIQPKLPKALDGTILTYQHGEGTVRLRFKLTGTRRIVYDGVELSGDDRIPLVEGKDVLVLVEC